YLASTIGKAHFGGMIGHFAFVVVGVERDRFVVTLNQPATWGVVTGGCEREARIFAERLYDLHQSLAKCGFAHDDTAIVVLYRASNNLRGGSRIIVHQQDERLVVAMVAAQSVVAALRRCTAALRNDELILVQEHVADGHGLIDQAAG